MAIRINRGSSMQQLPVVPLVDTVLNLLIFFLVATKFAEVDREMDLLLPEASEARAVTAKPREMFINIDADGRYYVNSKSMSVTELGPVLKAAWVNNPGRVSVVIRADQRCRWRYVVAAMNACTKAKIRDYRVTTRETREGSG